MSNNCFGNYTTTGAAGPSVCNPAPVCCTPAEPPELETENESTETCACRDSLAAALQLLCSGDLPALIDFNRFAFLASSYLIGSYLVCPCGQTGTYDNLADTLTGSFNRFTPCSCELIDVSGQVYDAIPYYRPQTVANLFTVMSENLDGVEDAQGTINALAALAARIDPGSADFRPDLLEAFQPLLGACSCPNVSISEVSRRALPRSSRPPAIRPPSRRCFRSCVRSVRLPAIRASRRSRSPASSRRTAGTTAFFPRWTAAAWRIPSRSRRAISCSSARACSAPSAIRSSLATTPTAASISSARRRSSLSAELPHQAQKECCKHPCSTLFYFASAAASSGAFRRTISSSCVSGSGFSPRPASIVKPGRRKRWRNQSLKPALADSAGTSSTL